MLSSTPQAILLVDGYNVIGAWHCLKQTRDRLGLEEARRELADFLIDYSAYQNFETHIVFDSQYQDTPGSRERVTGNLTICYTDYRQTADSYIEKTCALYRKDVRKFEQRLIVATSDRAQQLTVTGYGAEWMSAHQLLLEVELAAQRVRRKQQPTRKGRSPKRLISTLDPEAQQQLAQMRMGITRLDSKRGDNESKDQGNGKFPKP
ncbi:MAG: NYN domain-containing protein [Cyanobacteria bacterium CRU_2_1]|nr:NYN domain-containing protein [Cyanobacteria bacterium RU_5_0]NJR62644.1 NYN domain-containing protein [Cyanobacteria bacterium CRU_2_1]